MDREEYQKRMAQSMRQNMGGGTSRGDPKAVEAQQEMMRQAQINALMKLSNPSPQNTTPQVQDLIKAEEMKNQIGNPSPQPDLSAQIANSIKQNTGGNTDEDLQRKLMLLRQQQSGQ